ncbi:MAG: alpha/beta family hydrolase [Saprospiraceae bacterium]
MMKLYTAKRIQFQISEEIGSTSALYIRPVKPKFLLVLAHGAGAGMEHFFMETLAQFLAQQKVATLRFNFAYMENGKKIPDRPKKALPAISAAINQAKKLARGVPVLIGGKSFGGRMCSQLADNEELTGVEGIIYFGFPLHAIGKPSMDRAVHLSNISQPQLFLQGTRDTLAEINLIKQVCKKLKRAKLEIFEGGDHSFKMLKKTGVPHEEMIEKLAKTAAEFNG